MVPYVKGYLRTNVYRGTRTPYNFLGVKTKFFFNIFVFFCTYVHIFGPIMVQMERKLVFLTENKHIKALNNI